MPSICNARRKQRGTIVILYSLMLMFIIIPLAGLAVDLTIMYIVQAKLWEAIDGAALEAGHLMGTSAETLSAQAALAQQICATNFPTGYWNAYGLSCIATPSLPAAPDYMYKVDITAKVSVPLWFMKVFQATDAAVSASAESSRRQARVILVLDRSGSMSGTIATLKNAAAAFVTKFNGGYDELGLVIYGTSGVVVYPVLNNGPYSFQTNIPPVSNTDPNGGPNTQFKAANGNNASGTTCCDMIYAINSIGSAGATNMSEGLSLAYLELQKGHNASMSANGYDVNRSVIVLFTDGVPNMFDAYLNSPDALSATMSDVVSYPVSGVLSPGSNLLLGPKAPFANASPTPVPTVGKSSCYYNPLNTAVPASMTGKQANQMIGIMGAGGAPSSFTSNLNGLIQMASTDTKTFAGGSGSSAWSLQWAGTDQSFTNGIDNSSVTDCLSLSGAGSTSNSLSVNSSYHTGYLDLSKLPPWDVFGNNLTALGNGYTYSTATGFPAGTGINANVNGVSDSALGQQLNIAAWNAVDNAANRIRSDIGTNSWNVNPTIYTIGYSGNGGTDDMLLSRVANDPGQNKYNSASTYNQSQNAGQYFPASDSNAIVDAFNKIGSILLNLSR